MALRTFVQDSAGNLVVNPAKMYVQPYILLPDSPNEAVTVAANSASQPLVLTGPQEGPFEAFFLAARCTSLAIRVTFEYRKRQLQNYGIHGQTILGCQYLNVVANGFVGYILPETLWLLPRETLIIQATDLSGDTNILKFSLHGRLYSVGATPTSVSEIPKTLNMANRSMQMSAPFWYTTENPPLTLSANQTVQTSIHIGRDGAFELHKIGAYSTGAFSVVIYDPNSGRRLTSGAVHSDLLTGNAWFPYILAEPLFMKRNSWLKLDITDLSGSENSIYLTLAGRRIYQGDEGL